MRLTIPAGLISVACMLLASYTAGAAEAAVSAVPVQGQGINNAFREDQKIEARAIDLIYEQFKVFIHVNVTSFNRNVLISGEVPDEATSSAIEKIVSGIEGVRSLNNELLVSENSSLSSRSNDSWITTNVKLRFARDKRISTDRIRAVTEKGTVFLMGNISRSEGDAAADIASTTNRVVRVVKLFEYTD